VTVADPLAARRCVVVGGAGAVGGMLTDLLLAAGTRVLSVDVRATATEASMPGDITCIGPRLARELARADIVVLAVPEPVALEAVPGVAGVLRPGALLVDTASVKGRIVEALRIHAPHLEALSLNPMFAPSLAIEGRPVAAVVVRGGPRTRELLDALGRRGGRLVLVTEDEHDRLAGATQALTHATVLAFGLALAQLDVDVDALRDVAPPPHLALLALLARLASGEPHTYWDVQANPEATRARAALARSVRRLADVLDEGGEAGLADVFGELRGLLGPDLDHYRELSARTFDAIHREDRKVNA
jgi:prephenate dehydrogenase